MTRPNLIALVLTALAGLSSVITGVSVSQSRDELESLQARAEAVETTRHLEAARETGLQDNTGLARDIAALRTGINALTRIAAPAGTDATSKSPEDEKSQEAWTRRMVRAISESLEARLSLSPERKAEIAEILLAAYAALAEANRIEPSPLDVKEQVARVQAETSTKIRALLTGEQRTRFAELTGGPGGVFGMELLPSAGRLPDEAGSSTR